jgi:predicted nicotinamide N-methyase
MISVPASSISKASAVEAFIRANLPLRPVPFVPEIRLHKADARSGLNRLADADEDFGSPYWAHYWGGGLALARYLLDHSALVRDRSLLDLGTGSGIVAIAAVLAGARQVQAADVDPYAIAAARLNAAANGVEIATLLADLTLRPPSSAADVLVIGDLFYDPDTAPRVLNLARRHAAMGAMVLIGDPLRAHLPLDLLDEVARYSVSELTGDIGEGAKPACVYRLRA